MRSQPTYRTAGSMSEASLTTVLSLTRGELDASSAKIVWQLEEVEVANQAAPATTISYQVPAASLDSETATALLSALCERVVGFQGVPHLSFSVAVAGCTNLTQHT